MYRLKVREVALRKAISQRQLFFRSGVDIKTIQRIYRNPTTTVVTVETLAKLAQALGVDVSELIESEFEKSASHEAEEARLGQLEGNPNSYSPCQIDAAEGKVKT